MKVDTVVQILYIMIAVTFPACELFPSCSSKSCGKKGRPPLGPNYHIDDFRKSMSHFHVAVSRVHDLTLSKINILTANAATSQREKRIINNRAPPTTHICAQKPMALKSERGTHRASLCYLCVCVDRGLRMFDKRSQIPFLVLQKTPK
jgi:hypothetical protein